MKTIDLHPEHLIDAELDGGIDPTDAARLAEHRAQCAACAIERTLAGDLALEPDDDDRARAARIVQAMFEGDAPLAHPAATHDERRDEPRELGALWIAASIVVHTALLALAVLIVSPLGERGASLPDPIEISLLPPTAVSEPGVSAPSAEGAAARAPAAGLVPLARSARVRRAAMAVHVEPTVAPLPVEPGVVPAPAPTIDRDRLRILLDPARVARGGVMMEGAPSQRGAPAGLARDEGPDARALGRELSEGLRADAMTKTYTARERPELHRRADGSHVYAGPRFAAVVRPDGSVEFQDRPGIATNGFSLSGTFDATEAIMGAAGQDPLRAERDWFMRHTEALRHRLETEHRRAQMATALPRLRGRLERVWATERRSAAARRRRIFALWDDMAEDDTGRDARRVVIEFVREVLPAASDDAYSEQELRRLNASRESREAFAPY